MSSIVRPVVASLVHSLVGGMGCALPWEAPRAGVVPFDRFDVIREGDDATFAGGALATWPSQLGPTPTIPGTNMPLDGARVRNGHQGVLYPPSQAVLEYAAAIKAGTFDRGYVEIVKHPDDAWYPGGIYQYDLCIDGGVVGQVHFVCEAEGAQAGVTPYSVAMFLGGAGGLWHPVRRPTNRPQVLAYKWLNDTAHFYRNGVKLGSFTGTPRTFNTTGAREGNNRIASQRAGFRGAYYSRRYAFGNVPSDAQIAMLHAERMAKFAIDANAWEPLSLTTELLLDSSAKFGTLADASAAWEGGANRIRRWYNRGSAPDGGIMEQHSDFLNGSNNGNDAPDEGVRINGLPSLKFGTLKHGSMIQTLDKFITTTAFDFKAIVRVDSITSTQASNPYERDALFAETVAGVFAVSAATMSGFPSVGCCFFDNQGAGLARWKYPNVPIALGVAGLLHVKLSGGVLSVQWNDGTPATASVAALADALTRTTGVGRGYNVSPNFKGDVATVLCRKIVPSAANNAAERAWLAADYGVAA